MTAGPGTYALVPQRCAVRFHTAHAFGLGRVDGTLAVRDGTAVVGERPADSRVTVTLDATSFTTDRSPRDHRVRSKTFLDSARYPLMSFTGADPGPDADGGWRLAGELTVRGVAVPVVLSIVRAHTVDGELRCRATARVDRYAFGVTAGRGVIRRHLDVDLDIVASRM
jgi:polyisoprenoid-binding protein YceI